MASTTQSSSRGPILAALTGLVLLGLMVAFTLGLNAADDDTSVDGAEPVAASTEPIELPDALPGDLVNVTSDAMPTDLVDQLGGKETITDSLDNGAEGMEDLYGGPAALAIYGHTDASALVTVAVASTTGGLFMPDGLPPLDPEALGVARAAQVLEAYDGAICNVGYQAAIEEGQPVDETEVPASTICQYSADGRTYQLSGNGLSEEQAVTALKALAAYVGGDEDAVPTAPPAAEVTPQAPTTDAPTAPTTPAPAS